MSYIGAASVPAPAAKVAGPPSATPAAIKSAPAPTPAAPAPPSKAPSGIPASARVWKRLLPAGARVCKPLLPAFQRPVREPRAPPAGLALPRFMLGVVAPPLGSHAPTGAAHMLPAVAPILGATGVPAPSCSECNDLG